MNRLKIAIGLKRLLLFLISILCILICINLYFLISREADGIGSYTVYEKYFGLKQGDLARSMNIKNTDELGKEGFLNSHFGGITIDVGEAICVQYSNTDSVPLYREMLFGGMCSIMLPQSMTDMDRIGRMVRCQGRNRPPVIKTDADREATVTFSLLPISDRGGAEPVTVQLAGLRSEMKRSGSRMCFTTAVKCRRTGLPSHGWILRHTVLTGASTA